MTICLRPVGTIYVPIIHMQMPTKFLSDLILSFISKHYQNVRFLKKIIHLFEHHVNVDSVATAFGFINVSFEWYLLVF